ncbi:TIGR00375 family protein [Frankia sp. EI5c]|uniref:UvrD-helicase domain-containing protein n=1 Tax=Frankia sp. EI5c TaxID=683316 RepID=UPI0007C31553|nr:UvrD-helicase domain-containing protein [Frankia sp. EI5c]OAA24975.1 TIGR00375 family protein [Frankia sp. EI5c]
MRSRFFADTHVHSRYSRACSRDCDLEHLAWWAARKGIRVVGTGDFTHPAWSQELATKLVPAEPGLFRLRPDLERDVLATLPASCRTATRFMISTEISTIYKRGDRTRKVHHLLYAPDREAAGRITSALARIGNLAADGRPILGLDSRDLLEIALGAGEGCYLVPAHVWTPWFAVLGSKSGFDAVEDCYADLADHVFALETGLSADPEMFWRISGLDRYRLVSNSDAHSPPMLGREATVFTCEPDYFSILAALRTGNGFGGTVEFFPEEGKYHHDGHRRCAVALTPEETRELGGICPVCGRPLTVGVLNRVDTLADRDELHRPDTAGEVTSLVALPEIVGEILGVGPKSKSVATQVTALVSRLGPELGILSDVPLDAIAEVGSPTLVEGIGRLRRGEVIRQAGYDGEYGVIRLFEPDELTADAGTLFDVRPTGTGPVPGRGSSPRKGRGAARPSALAPSALAPSGEVSGPLAPGADVPGAGTARTAEARAGRAPGGAAGHRVPSVLDGLDPDQRRAAAYVGGPLLVLAGPGTGKTRTLVHSIAHRVRELAVPAEQCLAVTFTRRAAGELRERLEPLLGPGQAAGSAGSADAAGSAEATGSARADPVATTFHGLGLMIVREQYEALVRAPEVRVADDAVRAELLDEALHGAATSRARGRVAAELSALKRRRALGQPYREDPAAGVLARYDAALRDRNMVDLDDLVTLPLGLLRSRPELAAQYRRRWRHVWVDEFQDIDEVQYGLLRELCPPDGDLCAIGDPDQAIYSFRGAEVGFFLRFEEDHPGARRVSLTRNYRSTPTIVAAALDAIAPATFVPGRELRAVTGQEADGPVVVRQCASEAEEANAVADLVEEALGGTSFHAIDSGVDGSRRGRLSFADIAVLYRTARQAEPVVDALLRRGFPFRQHAHTPLADLPAVAALLADLRDPRADPGDVVAGAGAGAAAPRSVTAHLRDAAARLADLAANAGTALAAVLAEGPAEGRAVGRAAGRPPTEAEIRRAVELLTPAAVAAGDDLGSFLTAVTLGTEVDGLDPRADRISLLTLHASKGLEFGLVIIVGCEDGLLPLRWGGRRPAGAGTGIPETPETPEIPETPEVAEAAAEAEDAEERRLFFVGITRARRQLVLTHAARRRRGAEAVVETGPSPFLAAIDGRHLEKRAGSSAEAARARRRSAGQQLRLM